jgi:hypothetical protein
MRARRLFLAIAAFWSADGEVVTLSMVVFNQAKVPPEILARAETHYAGVFRQAGIEVKWVHPDPGSSEVRSDASALAVYLISRGQAKRLRARTSGCLGVSLLMPGAGHPIHVAAIFYDRINARVDGNPSRLPLILGHVMTHETGHLLLGKAHSLSVIMREGWSTETLSRIEQGAAVFTSEESSQMRSTLQARQKMADPPDH